MERKTESKDTAPKGSKVIDIKQYRIYSVTQEVYSSDRYLETEIRLFGKDENIKVPHEYEIPQLKIKHSIAVPKGKKMPKHFSNMKEYNQAVKEVGAVRL